MTTRTSLCQRLRSSILTSLPTVLFLGKRQRATHGLNSNMPDDRNIKEVFAAVDEGPSDIEAYQIERSIDEEWSTGEGWRERDGENEGPEG